MATQFDLFASWVCGYYDCQECPFHLINSNECTKSGFTFWLESEVEE